MYYKYYKTRTKIIAEIHPQHHGSMNEIKRIILQCKLGGADFVKIQLYSSFGLFGNRDRDYLEVSKKELAEIKKYCDLIGINLFASIFDKERVEWCKKLNFSHYKIASRSIDDTKLCKKIINTKKTTLISLGMYDFKSKKIPFKNKNIKYLYCVSKYPTSLGDIEMPDFTKSFFSGYSDHTIGISAVLLAISRGAEYIEKHFSNNKASGSDTEMAHVCSMGYEDLKFIREYADNQALIKKI